ncbi:MAG: hypothetical protein AAF829_03820 [Pseudomonadota bacterium]
MIPPRWSGSLNTSGFQVAFGIALTVLILWIWGLVMWNGLLPGNDDMMRLAQVRDLLAGQGWYDVDQSRFDTPAGGAMHWSRLPDILIGGLILILTPFLGAETAEFAALAFWPRLFLAGTLTAIAVALHRLGVGRAGIAAGLVAFMVSHAVVQFQPGRIDHHGLELMLVLAACAALCAPQRGWKTGLFVAGCVSLMLTVAIESLPYAAGLILFCGLLWSVFGAREASMIKGLGAGLAGFSILAYLLDAPGIGAARAACDAFGNVHASALILGGLGLLALGTAGDRLRDWRARLAVGTGLGVAASLSALAVEPSCLGSPYSGVDAAIMEGWMTSVTEARSLPKLVETSPAFAFAAFGFGLAALAGAVFSFKGAAERQRSVLIGLMGLTVIALLVMAWQVRAVVFVHGFAAIGVGFVAHYLILNLVSQTGTARIAAFAGLIALSPTTWQTAGTYLETKPTEVEKGASKRSECRSAEAMARLQALPPSRVFTPIDLGPAVLIHTDHTIFAAPYHRNPGAIGRTLDVFESDPATARKLLQAAGADYLYVCNGLGELALYARRSPDGLAATLLAGDAPSWLEGAGETDANAGPRLLRIRHDAIVGTNIP